MTQRYFAQGKHALSIRNSSNYQVLMRNADERINLRAADSMNLKQEVLKANEFNENEMYPYMFIDRSNQARVTGIKVYIDLFSKCMKVIMGKKLKALVDWKEFTDRFRLIDQNVAIENALTTKSLPQPSTCLPERSESKSKSAGPKSTGPEFTGPEPSGTKSTGPEPSGTKSTGPVGTEPPTKSTENSSNRNQIKRKVKFHQRKQFTRQVERLIHRYNLKTKL